MNLKICLGGDLMDFIYVFLFLTIFVAIITLLYYKITNKALNNIRIVEIFLLSFLVISVGIGGIWAFIGHAFLPAQVAANIGWPASPFQLEVSLCKPCNWCSRYFVLLDQG